MSKNKFVTYNFYKKDGNYYILQYNQHIEVTENVFNVYKNSAYAHDYSDIKYYNNNFSLENSTTTVYKEIIEQQFSTIENDFMIKESNREFLMKFKPKVRQTIILWLEGYNDTEIAEKIGISCRYIRKIRAKLKQMLK